MTFGQADPVHIEEIKRETADDGAKKKRALELEPKLENAGKRELSEWKNITKHCLAEGEQSVLGPLTPLEETPQKDEVKPVPVKKSQEPPKELKKVEKRRQHRSRSKPSLAESDKDGIEVA